MRRLLAILAVLLAVSPALALSPDEQLGDPALEHRARAISAHLRCLVCQNQSIDDSDAPLAKDLRTLVREQLVQGKTDPEIMEFVVARYGEFVLLTPAFSLGNLALWGGPLLVVILGGGLLLGRLRRPPPEEHLTAEEIARLKALSQTHTP